MKRLLKVAAVCTISLTLLAIAGYFALTNPGLQKRYILSKLPDGSRIGALQINLHKVQLENVIIQRSPELTLSIDSLSADLDLRKALFEHTLVFGKVVIAGLHIEQSTDESSQEKTAVTESFVQLKNWDWPIHIDFIQIGGNYTQASQIEMPFELVAEGIAPGEQNRLSLKTGIIKHPAFTKISAAAEGTLEATFTQSIDGALKIDQINTTLSASDSRANALFNFTQESAFEHNTSNETVTIQTTSNGSLNQPIRLSPELAPFPRLDFAVTTTLQISEQPLRLQKARADISTPEKYSLILELTQAITPQNPEFQNGPFLNISSSEWPLSLISPYLSPNLRVSGAVLPTKATLRLEPGGNYRLDTNEPVRLESFGLDYQEKPLLENTQVQLNGSLTRTAEGQIDYRIDSLELRDELAELINLSAQGQFQTEIHPMTQSRLSGDIEFSINCARLSKQPFLTEKPKLLSGKLSGRLSVQPKNPQPYQFEAQLIDLRIPSEPIKRSYFAAGHTKPNTKKQWAFLLSASEGSEATPSSSIIIDGTLRPTDPTLDYTLNINSQEVEVADFIFLTEAFTPEAKIQQNPTSAARPSLPGVVPKQAVKYQEIKYAPAEPPFWLGSTGQVSASIDSLLLSNGLRVDNLIAQARVHSNQIFVEAVDAKLGTGILSAVTGIQYQLDEPKPFTFQAKGVLKEFYPSSLKTTSNPLPIQGAITGSFDIAGTGQTLQIAREQAYGAVEITSKEGIFTAFQLNQPRKLGLAGAGLAGLGLSALLDNDAIQDTTQALLNTLPYFQSIPYDSLDLTISRQQNMPLSIDAFSVYSPDLRIDATGAIASKDLRGLTTAPLHLDIQLSAKGALANQLNTLQLLNTEPDINGFLLLKKPLEVDGSLEAPDTSDITRILTEAAQNAFSKSGTSASNLKNTTNEKLGNEIEKGLKLFESLLGQ
jgi:hypothetical protein